MAARLALAPPAEALREVALLVAARPALAPLAEALREVAPLGLGRLVLAPLAEALRESVPAAPLASVRSSPPQRRPGRP